MVALIIFTVLALVVTISHGQQPSPRIQNGISADTMRRFPHHVSIQPFNKDAGGEALPNCSGSIIAERWVLTSLSCVDNAALLQIEFEKLRRNKTIGSYSAVVNNDEKSVTKYPTHYDDIALIKLPFKLVFSDTIKPIGFASGSSAQMLKKLAVLPGFDSQGGKDQLTYAMLTLAPNSVCQNTYGNLFDEFLNICAVQSKQRNSPCSADAGSGLIVNWPAKPELIGMFSSLSNGCNEFSPTSYINLEKYVDWIRSYINEYEDIYSTTSAAWS